MKRIVGRKYLPIDNSYSVNITKCTKRDAIFGIIENKGYISGTCAFNYHPHPCIILTNPFKATVHLGFADKTVETQMVVVKDLTDNQCHTVMFYEAGLNIKQRVKIINDHIKLNGNKEEPFNPKW